VRKLIKTKGEFNFDWDENKRQTNIRKNGIDFIDAHKIFDYDTVIIEDDLNILPQKFF
jgi:uncharacterized DUF497 family protein